MNSFFLMFRTYLSLQVFTPTPYINAIIQPLISFWLIQFFVVKGQHVDSNYLLGIIPGFFLMLCINSAYQGMVSEVNSCRSNQVFAFLRSTHCSRIQLFAATYLNMLILIFLESIILYIVAYCFGARAVLRPEQLLPFMILLLSITLSFGLMGIFVASVCQKPTRVSLIGHILMLALPFFSGGFGTPAVNAPLHVVREIILYNPFTFFTVMVHSVLYNQPIAWEAYTGHIIGLLLIALLCLLGAKKYDHADYKYLV